MKNEPEPGTDNTLDHATSEEIEILFVIHSLRGGGTGRVCAALARGLAQRGHHVTVAVSFWEKSVWHDAFGDRVELIELGAGHARNAVTPLVRLLQERAPKAVLAFNYQLAIALLFARSMARLGGRTLEAAPIRLVSRHIVALTESAQIKSWWHRFMIRTVVYQLYRRMDYVVAQSQGMYQDLLENFHISPERSTVIYNPVLPATTTEAMEHAFEIDASRDMMTRIMQTDPAEAPFVLYLGRFKPQKQPLVLLDLVERLRRSIPQILLVTGGDGPMEEEFITSARERGLEEAVCHLGYVRNTTPLFERAAVTVLTSAYEGFPNILIDSISHGTPVVSFDCPTGPSEIIQDGTNGYLVPINDLEAMTQSVLRLIATPLQKTAVTQTAARFSLDHALDRYEAVLHG